MRMTLPIVLAAMGALWAGRAAAQAQNGEFLVNSYTTGYQVGPAVAMDAQGRFVVAWQGPDCCGRAIEVKAQRFDALGLRLGAEFALNSYTTGLQFRVSVAGRPDGGFVAAWQGPGPSGEPGVFARLFDDTGTPLGPEFRAQAATTANGAPSVAVDAAGGFVVAWPTFGGAGAGIFARRFSPSGIPSGGDISVGSSSSFVAVNASAAVAADGAFVVAWNDAIDSIAARRFDASGAPVGAQFRVNGSTAGTSLQYPRAAADPGGGFVVAWGRSVQSGSPPKPDEFSDFVHARAFDAAGQPRGSEFLAGTSHGVLRALAAGADGTFVVAWHTNYVLVPGPQAVRAQRFDRAGRATTLPFDLNIAAHQDREPALAIDPAGNMVAAWDADASADGSGAGVLARRFRALRPAALLVDANGSPAGDGNRVLEAGESVTVAPAWRNTSQLTEAFTGVASMFTGPGTAGDPTYTIADGAAVYEPVPSGATRSCGEGSGNCYALSISLPAARPVPHWDASVSELLTPASAFPKAWTLHVGESFTDVARTSPFYPFVETLFHRGVTAGCGTAAYCPGANTTREQMAVFLLTAREGPGYQPAACAPPNVFGDVPETSAYCRWIEELSARGVTAGCGGGNYCPAAPVTRQEMAVFVLRTLDGALDPPPCTTPLFTDVPAASPFCRWIEELARRGVVAGCGDGAYCPTAPVTREQMSVFLGATFGLTLYGL